MLKCFIRRANIEIKFFTIQNINKFQSSHQFNFQNCWNLMLSKEKKKTFM